MTAAPALRTWYFATNRHGLMNAFDQIQVAVLSARQHTALSPVCLVDAGANRAEVGRQLGWLQAHGVRLVFHTASLLGALRSHFGAIMDVYSGHWLRCDIPMLEQAEEYVLYTDFDVMFSGPVEDNPVWPRLMACGPERDRSDATYFNSGVMIMNLPNLRPRLPELRAMILQRLDCATAHDDQGALNVVFRGEWDWLPPAWNWKPYWGRYDGARIVHFHGPKPTPVRRMLQQAEPLGESEFERIFKRNPDGYRHYTERFFAILDGDAPA